MTDQNVHVIIRPGDGLVARFGSGVLVMRPGGSEQVQQQLLDAMRDACEGQSQPGRMMARKLVGILSQAEPDDVPAFGACAPNERGWAVILHQGVALNVARAEGATTLSGHDASTWVDRIVEGGFESLTLLPEGEEVGVINNRFRFQGGLVPGGGATVILEAGGAAGEQAPSQPAQMAQPMAPAQPVAPQPVVAQPVAPQPVAPAQPVAPQPVSPQPVVAQPVVAQPVAPQPVAAQPPAMPPVQPAPPVPAAEASAPQAMDDQDEPPTIIQRPNRDVESPGEPEQADDALPEDDVPFESVSLLDIGPEAKRDPLTILSADTPKEDVEDEDSPLVYGVLSPNGYFNHPDALYCAVTGVSMLHRTHVLVQRPRPPLGVIVADDGSTFTLNTDYVVGREPERDPQVEADEARPLKLQDAERSLSRVHAKVRLIDWDVFVVDNSSANGTYILPRGAQQWKRLVADTPEKIVPGTRIAFGKRVMTFESHHQINQSAAS